MITISRGIKTAHQGCAASRADHPAGFKHQAFAGQQHRPDHAGIGADGTRRQGLERVLVSSDLRRDQHEDFGRALRRRSAEGCHGILFIGD